MNWCGVHTFLPWCLITHSGIFYRILFKYAVSQIWEKKMTNITKWDRIICSVNSTSYPKKAHPQFYFEWTSKRGNCLRCSQYGEVAYWLLLNVVCLDTIFPKVYKNFLSLVLFLPMKQRWLSVFFLIFCSPLFPQFLFYIDREY